MGYAWSAPTGRVSAALRIPCKRIVGQLRADTKFSELLETATFSARAPSPTTVRPSRWTAAHGLKQIPMNIASAITADGTMVAGGDNWWKTSGQTGIFGPFPGNQNQTQPHGLAETGQAPVAVGGAIKDSDVNGATFHAFKWTPAGGLQDLGVTTGTQSTATAISANGLVVVGYATDPSNFLSGVSLDRLHRHAGFGHSGRPGELLLGGQCGRHGDRRHFSHHWREWVQRMLRLDGKNRNAESAGRVARSRRPHG
jgi:hypothetical protein